MVFSEVLFSDYYKQKSNAFFFTFRIMSQDLAKNLYDMQYELTTLVILNNISDAMTWLVI